MRRDDPLEDWLFLHAYRSEAELAEREQREVGYVSRQLLAERGQSLPRTDARTALDSLLEVYRQIYATGGTGNTLIQDEILTTIGRAADPETIPFWLETLTLSRPRDLFAKRRRPLALAALAYLAIRRSTPEAYTALRDTTHHDLPEVRALAVRYLGRVYQQAQQPLPSDVVAEISDIAAHDPAFSPRFQARLLLHTAGLPVPLDNPGGVYVLKVKFMWAKRIYRSIAVRSEQTLDDLHFAIQRAIDWDADHLYSFFMNGIRFDDAYRVRCPYEEDEDVPFDTAEAIIGELGLVPKHKFLYYFDYGDGNEFEIEVVDIRPQAEPGVYPRVVDGKGEAPAQYDVPDEDEDDEPDAGETG
jgi:hypothetical protein